MRIVIAGSTGLVGRLLAETARERGHRVVGLARSQGTDLVTGPPPDLRGADAVVDVSQGADHDGPGATAFFSAVAATLGAASRAAAVPRTVVLSILGVEETAAEQPYHAAKVVHERATRAAADGVRVLHAAHFHDFPAQWVMWMQRDGRVPVPEQAIQPVAVTAVVDALLELATDAGAPDRLDLAGPRVAWLPELVRRTAPTVEIVPVAVGPAIGGGALLAKPGTRIAGPDWDTWAAAAAAAGGVRA